MPILIGSQPVAVAAAPGSITNAMLATMADSTVKGVAVGSGTSAPVDLTPNQQRTIANTATNAAVFYDVQMVQTAPAISAGVLTLNLTLGNVFVVSLNAAITTLTVSNPAASGKLASFQLVFVADGTARAVTYMSGILWPGGAAPTLTSTSTKRDFLQFESYDGGTTWFGFVMGQNF